MFFTVNNILLVGGTGYLGRHLAKRLVTLGVKITSTGSKISNNTEEHAWIDFNIPKSFSSIDGKVFDVIIILASRLDALSTSQIDHSILDTNVLGLGRFLEYVKKNNSSNRLVYISSMTVYNPYNESPVKENNQLSPHSTYGLSKKLAESVFEFYCLNQKSNGVIMRLPGVFGGDRKSGFIYNTIQKISSGQKVILNTKGLEYWETIHISDLVEMIASFLTQYKWNEPINTFNFSYGEETDFYTTAYHIAKNFNKIQLLITEDKKGYTRFFLSNEKVSLYTKPSMSYWARLQEYIDSIV